METTRGSETSQYPPGKENNSDFLSSGERKGNSLNQFSVMSANLANWCCGSNSEEIAVSSTVKII